MSLERSTTNLWRYGKKEELPQALSLRAGRLSVVYENGFLRYIRSGNAEIVRMINHAVRDHNWGTVPLRILSEQIEQTQHSFTIRYEAEARQGDIHVHWDCRIEGSSDSELLFEIIGEARSDFRRNRFGFTVLHPIRECAGREVRLHHPDGSSEKSRFPELISPHQPFFELQGMSWAVGETQQAHLEFAGDIFETEDQRNWLDDSYKTYCTPLRLPFPVAIKKGDKVRQTIRLKVSGSPDTASSLSPENFHFEVAPEARRLPRIGIGQSSEAMGLSAEAIRRLKAAGFQHYQVDLKLYDAGWPAQWQRGKAEAKQLGLPLELNLFFDHIEPELAAILAELQEEHPPVHLLHVFNRQPHATQAGTLAQVLPALRAALPDARIGAGTNAFFTELNRDRTPAQDLDFLVYSVNPQVHAVDNGTLVENLNTLNYTAQTAAGFSGKAVHISPITFKMRWNPNATGEKIVLPGHLPDEVDTRQFSLFGGAFVLGALNQLVEGPVAAASFFQTVGRQGIMQSHQPLSPDLFPAPADVVYPMYFVFSHLLPHQDAAFFPLRASHPLVFTGLALRPKNQQHELLLLANFTASAIRVSLPAGRQSGKARVLHSEVIEDLMKRPESFEQLQHVPFDYDIALPPFGIAFLECSA